MRTTTSIRSKIARLLILPALLAPILAAPPASAAARPAASTAKASWDSIPQAAVVRQAAAACPARTRTLDCDRRTGRVRYFVDGVQVGVATYVATTVINTKVNSSTFTARMTVEVVGTPGIPPGSAAIFTADCDSPCASGGEVTGPLITGAQFSGDFTFRDGTATRHTSEIEVTVIPVVPEADGQTPGRGILNVTVRCDDEFASSMFPGCVITTFLPTMTSMTQLEQIAINIRKIQARGGYGVPGVHPLHREADEATQKRNREQACNRRVTGDRPPGMSCDEYPFATTQEGGHNLPKEARGWSWVPEHEQNSQGGLVTGFYKQNRVLDGDPFYVKV
ncbi:NucA/NucB deoxyribonuclease domain-containing protein [Nonomuraea sp. NPDC050663]|uniref:NucA/NucB deoxyribonuclease domain-containing protein n=1 Tax=Nonomuraea sp. NPDC050663 TaxID=3364370 RepID=UPI0037A829B9